jgi:hypothetical protein
MGNFGYDKLNFFVPPEHFEVAAGGRAKMDRRAVLYSNGTETFKYTQNGIITTEILNDGNLLVSCNPSRLQEPNNYHNPKTYLTTNLEQLERTIERELEKVHIYTDNVLNLKICRLDVASQGVSKYPILKYKGALDLLSGKHQKEKRMWETTMLLKNSSFQSTIYDKSAHSRYYKQPIKDANLLRCEQRAVKTSSVNRYYGATLIELLNLPENELKKKYNKILDAKVFHKTLQLKFDFNTEKEIFDEILAKKPNNALYCYLSMEGVSANIQKMGGLDNLMEFLKLGLEKKSIKTLKRQMKNLNEVLIMWNRTQEQNEHNVINQTNEFKELFYQKIA